MTILLIICRVHASGAALQTELIQLMCQLAAIYLSVQQTATFSSLNSCILNFLPSHRKLNRQHVSSSQH